MNFLLYFLTELARSANYRSCSQIRFCNENRWKHETGWSLSIPSINVSDNTFQCQVLMNKQTSNLKLIVYQTLLGMFRFRVEPVLSKDNTFRYDASKEPNVFDQKLLNEKSAITYEVTGNKIYIRGIDDYYIMLNADNVHGNVYKGTSCLLRINVDNHFVFETTSGSFTEQFDNYWDIVKNGKTAVGIDFQIPGESTRLSGMTERYGHMNLGDTFGDPYRRYATDRFSHYSVAPLLIGHSQDINMALMWINPTDTFIDIYTPPGTKKVRYLSEGGYLDFLVFGNSMKDIVDKFTQLTGKPPMPPLFAFGYHQCRYGYETQTIAEEVLDGLEQNNIPFDVFWLDVDHLKNHAPFEFNSTAYPRPKELIERLAKDNRFVVRLCDPHLPHDVKHKQFKEALDNGYLMTHVDGNTYYADCWPGESAWPDYFNSKVRAWWADQYKYNNLPDVTAPNVFFWNDMNEAAVFTAMEGTFPKNIIHLDGTEVRETHNMYGLMMVSATFQGLIDRNEDKNMRPFLLTRSFFAGSQKFAWTWTGDNEASFDDLQHSVSMMIGSGLSGMPFTGTDVGGFRGNAPSDELLVRWFQTGAYLYPLFREHADPNMPYREPFRFQGETRTNLINAIKDRYRLLALWYTHSKITTQTGRSPVVPFWMEYPDSNMHDIHSQALLCDSLLVAPCLESGLDEVTVVKPPGLWYDFKTGEPLEVTTTVPVTMADVPVYIRGGRIVPIYENPGKNTNETIISPLTLYIAVDENDQAEGLLYLDDGTTYNFKKGIFMERKFTYNKGVFMCSRNDAAEVSVPSIYDDLHIEKIIIYGTKSEFPTIPGATVDKKDNVVTVTKLNIKPKTAFRYPDGDIPTPSSLPPKQTTEYINTPSPSRIPMNSGSFPSQSMKLESPGITSSIDDQKGNSGFVITPTIMYSAIGVAALLVIIIIILVVVICKKSSKKHEQITAPHEAEEKYVDIAKGLIET